MTDFIYTGIHVTNIDRSIRFYTRTLGMRLLFKASIKETGGIVAWLKSNRTKQILELNSYPKGYKYGGRSGIDHLAFSVKDVDASYKQMSKSFRGMIPPFLEGRWRLAYVKDPDGNWIELGQRLRKSEIFSMTKSNRTKKRS